MGMTQSGLWALGIAVVLFLVVPFFIHYYVSCAARAINDANQNEGEKNGKKIKNKNPQV